MVHARAEEWPDGIGAHDLVTARALAALPVLCEYAAPLLADGGALVAWKGAVDAGRAGRRRGRGRDPRPRAVRAARVVPYAGARDHTLHVFRKIAPTPDRFPRRPGMATKRPLSVEGSAPTLSISR